MPRRCGTITFPTVPTFTPIPMNELNKVQLSMLDLVSVREGGTVAEALAVALRTAQHA